MGDDLLDYDDDDDDDVYDGYAYRARPVVPGGVVFTLALRLGWTGRDLIFVAPRTSCVSGLGRVSQPDR